MSRNIILFFYGTITLICDEDNRHISGTLYAVNGNVISQKKMVLETGIRTLKMIKKCLHLTLEPRNRQYWNICGLTMSKILLTVNVAYTNHHKVYIHRCESLPGGLVSDIMRLVIPDLSFSLSGICLIIMKRWRSQLI